MRYRLQMIRFITAFVFVICAALLCYNLASAEQIPLHAYTVSELKIIAESNRQIEIQFPKGSRVYSFDSYQINDGPNSLTVGIDTTFRRDARGILYATDIGSGYTWTFSRRATIERKNNIGEQILRPNEPPSATLRNLLILNGARLVKVVTYGPTAVLQPNNCPLDEILRQGPQPQCVTPPRWQGGGQGTVDPPYIYLTAMSNSCAIKFKSLVTFSYTVKAAISPPPVTTSFCATLGGAVQPCIPFAGDAPGSSHTRSITYTIGGDVFASLGFHWSGGDFNGAGSGNAKGCFLVGGCS